MMQWLQGGKRLLRHLWWDASDSQRWVTPAAAERLAQRVVTSERRHTGEIRICVEASLPVNLCWPPVSDAELPAVVRARALSWFGQLGVWDTRDNNGVLVYLLLAERSLEIVADRGVSEPVAPEIWAQVLANLRQRLQGGEVEAGLAATIDAVDALLCRHFPENTAHPKPNELPDAVVLV